jgi:hypothetical protein
MFLAKYDNNGNLSWTKTWGGTGGDQGLALLQNATGYTVGGVTNSYGTGSSEIFIARYDTSGNIAGCGSPMCQSPLVSSTNISTSTVSPALSISSPSAGELTAGGTVSNFPLTTTLIAGLTIDAGSPLAPQNTPKDLANLTPVNLRIALATDVSGILTNGQNFKLQYAVKKNADTCAAVPSGSYIDVTTTTPIAYYDNSNYSSAEAIIENPGDPSDGSRLIRPQTYQESNTFTNSQSLIYAGEDGMWQFSLVIDNSTLRGKDYCLRIATSAGTLVAATNVADVSYAPQMQQLMRGGEWFDRSGVKQHISL